MENLNLKLGFIKRDRSITASILLSTSIVYALTLTFFNISSLNTTLIGSQENIDFIIILGYFLSLVAIYLGWYMNSIAMVARNREFAIQLTAGLSKPKAFGLAAIQSLFIVSVSLFLGIIISLILTPLLGMLLNALTGLNFITFGFSLIGFGLTLLIVAIQTFVMILNNGGLFYRAEAIDIINLHKKEITSETKNKPLLGILSLIAALSIFAGYFYAKDLGPGIDLYKMVDVLSTTSFFGLIGLKVYGFPYFIDFLCRKKLLNKKLHLLTIKELSFSIKQSLSLLILVLLIPQLALLTFNGVALGLPTEILTRVSLIFISLLITITIIFKLTLEGLNRLDSYKGLKNLGFSKEEILKIVKNKMILFTAYILFLPLALGLVSLHLYSLAGPMNMMFIIPFLIVTLILGIIAVVIAHRIIKNNILENLF
ncbi:FtsX-like permease family protein [uncultured Clostridium sp.]|jgi:putative ABC transport system permease protein|uniref:FtsX-like permease family protein n=1 Tax=uncultured Clostridium sp. TaxID=59620 RepID=UPI002638B2F7|nr:FtsX-like permease family protein [uncultured Clostridium sp.]